MLDPTLKVSVNYNGERERKRRERKRVHPFSHLFDTGAWGKKEYFVSSEKKKFLDGDINTRNEWKTIFLNKSIKK